MSLTKANGIPPAPGLILTQEQRGLKLLNLLHSEDGQVDRSQRAIKRAILAVNQDLADEGAKPSYTAVLGAIANVLADHLAQLPEGQRQELVASVAKELPLQVQARAEERV